MKIRFDIVDTKSWLVAIAAVAFLLSGCSGHIQPEEKFLRSKLFPADARGIGADYGTVQQFVDLIKTAQMANGKSMEVLGWKKDDNVYSLDMKAKEAITLRFVHVLSAPDNGNTSLLQPVSGGGAVISPLQFYYTITQAQPMQSTSTAHPPADIPKVASDTASPSKVTTDVPPPTISQPQDAGQKVVVEKEGPCKGMDLTVTASQIECLDKKFKIADSQLNDTYRQIVANLSNDEKAVLKKEQISWIKEKESKCANAGKVDAGGQMEAVLAADCKLQATESRLSYLKGYKQGQ